MPFAQLSLLLALILGSATAAAQPVWHYDMLLNRKIIGEQTLRLIPNESGALLIQTTSVEKKGWFTQFVMHSVSAEQLSPKGKTLALETRVTANGQTWWSHVFSTGTGLQGTGHNMGELNSDLQQKLAALDERITSEQPPALSEIKVQTESIFMGTPGEQQATLNPNTPFITSLNALPFYLKQVGRIPGALQLLDNEGLQVINSPIIDLGTQSMEIGGEHYTAHHIKVEKADAGTHIWFNEGDTGPVVLMIAGKSGKKKFQISLKEKQPAHN